MLYLLRILRKCRKLKNKYIIVMKGGATSILSNPNAIIPSKFDSSEIPIPSDPNAKGLSEIPIPSDPNAKGLSEEEEEALEANANAEDMENLIEQLNKELESLKKELLIWQDPINKIYEEIKKNPEINMSDLDPEKRKQIDKYDAMYADYKNLIEVINAAEAEAAGEKGFFATIFIEPLKKAIDKALKGVKNGAATAITGTFRFWTDVAAVSMEKMRVSLEKIQEVKAKIAAAGEIAKQKAMAGIPATASGLPATGLPATATGLPATGLPATATATGLPAITVGGGRYSNIKEVQKGGAAAAKRAQDSIKQFLTSSVTSSHILNMVKRKTKAKKKGNGKRYSRKRARK